MEKRFDDYFQRQLSIIYSLSSYYQDMLSHIETASSRLELTLRSDAKYFLAMNIVWMVLNPLSETDYTDHTVPFPQGDLLHDIKSDLDMILNEAATMAKDKGRCQISGTTILKALVNTIDALKITGLQIWGPTLSSTSQGPEI